MKKLFLLLSILALGLFTYAQNTGDVCIIGMNSDDPDKVLLVTFTDVSSGTVIYLTDKSWDGNAWSANEGFKSFTLNQDWTAGQVVELDLKNNTANPNIGTVASVGSSGFALGTKGDQLYVYLGSDENTPTTFLFAINTKGGWGTNELTNTGLTDGTNALTFPNSTDDVAYTGPRSGQATFNDYKTLIADVTNNWTTSNSSITFDLTNFVTGTITPTKLEIYNVSTNPTYQNWEFTVIVRAVDDNGNPGDVTNDTQYQLNTDGTGSFSTSTGTIQAGNSTDTITVSYDVAETFNMTASRVSGDNLATSAAVSMTINPLPTIASFPHTIIFDGSQTLFDMGIYTKSTSTNWYVSSFSGDYFMKVYGANNTAWAILPKITGAPALTMSFWNAAKKAGSELHVLVSTDYQGYGDPSSATWTDVTSNFTLSGGGWTGVSSGDADLSSYGSDFYVAFKYEETAGNTNTWEVDTIAFAPVSSTGITSPVNDEVFTVYPNPVSSVLYVNAGEGTLQILDNSGRAVKSLNVNGHASVDVADLAPGIYFARLSSQGQTQIRKFIKR